MPCKKGVWLLVLRKKELGINAMIANPDIRAIISTHGGVSANSCLPLLDYDLIRANPKILLGFSDISTLHLGIYSQTRLVTFHGNMVMYYFGMEPQPFNRQEFLSRLVLGEIGPVNRKHPVANGARKR